MPKGMTGRERMLAAIRHEQPDRVPLDLGGSRDSTMVVEAYERLRDMLGIEGKTELCNRMMRVVKMEEPVLQALDIDTRSMFPGAPRNSGDIELGPNRYRDIWGVERVRPEGSHYYDQVTFPLSGERSISEVARYPWPDPTDPGYADGLRERLDFIRANTDAAAILTIPAPCVHASQYVRGFEDWFMDCAANPAFLEALLDAALEVTMEIARRVLEAVGKDVDIVFCADDLGTQHGLMVRYEQYARFIKPRHKKYFDQIHDLSPAPIGFHCCGSLADIMEDLIELGVDVLNPVQVTAARTDPVELKKEYGGRMAFWGAMDTQHVLPHGTPEDVKNMVEQRIEQMGEGGGYILSACHNIQPDVPTENVLAMFRHAVEYVPSFGG